MRTSDEAVLSPYRPDEAESGPRGPDEAESSPRRPDEAESGPRGSDEAESGPWGSGEVESISLVLGETRRCAPVRLEVSTMFINSPSLGTPVLCPRHLDLHKLESRISLDSGFHMIMYLCIFDSKKLFVWNSRLSSHSLIMFYF